MFVRFIIEQRDDDSLEPLGIIQAAVDLQASPATSTEDRDLIHDTLQWFDHHLPTPDRFARSGRKNPHHRAISWFKATATEQIQRMNVLIGVLRKHHIAVRILRSKRPGYVVYEDDFQVVAEPFSGDRGVI